MGPVMGEVIIDGKKHPVRITLGKDKLDKLNAMRIALTYVESQEAKKTPEEVIKIADKFQKWLDDK